jgi:hypothetical protein
LGPRLRMHRKTDTRFVALRGNRAKYSLRGWMMKVAAVYLGKDETPARSQMRRVYPAEQVKKSVETRVKPRLNSSRTKGITTPITKSLIQYRAQNERIYRLASPQPTAKKQSSPEKTLRLKCWSTWGSSLGSDGGLRSIDVGTEPGVYTVGEAQSEKLSFLEDSIWTDRELTTSSDPWLIRQRTNR